MNERIFAGVPIGDIGLGCWQIGGSWGDVAEDDAMAILRAAYAQGTTFFDTADVYGMGRSESLIGRWLREDRPEGVFIATKQGRFSPPGWPDNFTLETMRAHVDASRQRLGMETLDLVQLHCIPTEALRDGAVFDPLRTLRAEGRIARFGASVESMDEALLCLEQDGISSLQILFNLFRPKPARVLFDRAQAKGVSLIARVPLASGLLAGRFRTDSTFAESDHRNFNRDGAAFHVGETFAGVPFADGVALAEQLREFVPAGWSMAQMALRWILDHPAVSVVIPGASTVAQAERNAAISDLPELPEELHRRLTDWAIANAEPLVRGGY